MVQRGKDRQAGEGPAGASCCICFFSVIVVALLIDLVTGLARPLWPNSALHDILKLTIDQGVPNIWGYLPLPDCLKENAFQVILTDSSHQGIVQKTCYQDVLTQSSIRERLRRHDRQTMFQTSEEGLRATTRHSAAESFPRWHLTFFLPRPPGTLAISRQSSIKRSVRKIEALLTQSSNYQQRKVEALLTQSSIRDMLKSHDRKTMFRASEERLLGNTRHSEAERFPRWPHTVFLPRPPGTLAILRQSSVKSSVHKLQTSEVRLRGLAEHLRPGG